jgi:Rps23 Pro-64 3,4-dihydroxylase Tpa1-like proline 4-hydroxylase
MLNESVISPLKTYVSQKLVLPDTVKDYILEENWPSLDEWFQEYSSPNGEFFQILKDYFPEIKIVEFIINIRDAANEYEEDGIWHDDGSRILAFSLGLNIKPKDIIGGDLLIRKKGEKSCQKITPPEFGKCYFFKTGTFGYEHKVCAVTKGRRIVIAGWCT